MDELIELARLVANANPRKIKLTPEQQGLIDAIGIIVEFSRWQGLCNITSDIYDSRKMEEE